MLSLQPPVSSSAPWGGGQHQPPATTSQLPVWAATSALRWDAPASSPLPGVLVELHCGRSSSMQLTVGRPQHKKPVVGCMSGSVIAHMER